jgi:hypothetical protein
LFTLFPLLFVSFSLRIQHIRVRQVRVSVVHNLARLIILSICVLILSRAAVVVQSHERLVFPFICVHIQFAFPTLVALSRILSKLTILLVCVPVHSVFLLSLFLLNSLLLYLIFMLQYDRTHPSSLILALLFLNLQLPLLYEFLFSLSLFFEFYLRVRSIFS